MEEKNNINQENIELGNILFDIFQNIYNSDEKFHHIIDEKEDIDSFNNHIRVIHRVFQKSFSFFLTMISLFYFSLYLSHSFERYYLSMSIISLIAAYAFQRIFFILYEHYRKEINSHDHEYCINKLKIEIEKRTGKEVVVALDDGKFAVGVKKEEGK